MSEDQRGDFEAWVTSPPIERDVSRHSKDPTISCWPGQYSEYSVQLAWESWCAATKHCGNEIERLRAALQKIADRPTAHLDGNDPYELRAWASAALGQKARER